MAKIGRNAPCPCGSGKKYKDCCGRPQATAAVATTGPADPTASPLPDPRWLERTMLDLEHLLAQQNFASIEEANAFLERLTAAGGQVPHVEPTTPLEQAQQVMYDAWKADDPDERLRLARRALRISADCADAHVLLAEEDSPSLRDAIDQYEQGVRAGERALGSEMFEEQAGNFWGIIETRPYMRARQGLAQCLWELGKRDESIAHYQDMLRLNPNDNQGVRFELVAWLLQAGDARAAAELIDRYPDDVTANWAYARALTTFRLEGDGDEARRQLAQAVKVNRHVPAYLLAYKLLPLFPPEYFQPGSDDEAADCVALQLEGWRATTGAIAWLERQAPQDRWRRGLRRR